MRFCLKHVQLQDASQRVLRIIDSISLLLMCHTTWSEIWLNTRNIIKHYYTRCSITSERLLYDFKERWFHFRTITFNLCGISYSPRWLLIVQSMKTQSTTVSMVAHAIRHTVRRRYKVVNFLTNIHKNTPHSSPVKARYGVYFVDSTSDWYSASIPAMIYVVAYFIGPRYNSTRLYPL